MTVGTPRFAPERPWPLPPPNECLFYHSIDFPDGGSVTGHWDIRGRFDQYIGHVPLGGRSVLDVGTATGFLAFSAEQRGARVTAYDAAHSRDYNRLPFRDNAPFSDREAWARREDETFLIPLKNGFWHARHRLGSQVEAVYAPLADLIYWERRFDVVMAGAIICHLADPVGTLGALARLADQCVIIAFEDVIDSDDILMRAANEWSNPTHDYTWWLLSRGLYRRVFANMGFRLEFRPCVALHNPTSYNDFGAAQELEKTTIIAVRE